MDKINLFGKPYNSIGSTDSNLIIQSKGDIKIRWGNKFIDLIKNGKLQSGSSSTSIITEISSADSITEDGIYLVDGKDVYISLKGNVVPITKNESTSIIYSETQDLSWDQKELALSNIGFYYDYLSQLSSIKKGLAYVKESQKLYVVNEGEYTEYSPSSNSIGTFNKITLGKTTISESSLNSNNTFNLSLAQIPYISILENLIKINKNIKVSNDISIYSDRFSITQENGLSQITADTINVNKLISNSANLDGLELTFIKFLPIDITVSEFRTLLNDHRLAYKAKYRITDFKNYWEIIDDSIPSIPIIITTNSSYTYEEECYFEEDPSYIFYYDITHNKEYNVNGTIVQSLGLITYMKDIKNNIECNFNFKDLRFRYEEQWYSLIENQDSNNIKINVNDVKVEAEYDGNIFLYEGQNCLIIKNLVSNLEINKVVGTNIINQKISNTSIKSIENIIFNGSINNSIIQTATNTNIFKLNLNNCQFLIDLDKDYELVDSDLLRLLADEEEKYIKLYDDNKLKIICPSQSTPSGSIIMWSGTKIPYGWVVCDGNNGTPNLVGKFVKAVSQFEDVGENTTDLDSNNQLIINEDNLPPHTHPHSPHSHTISSTSSIQESGDLLGSSEDTFVNSLSETQVISQISGIEEIITDDGIKEISYDTENVYNTSSSKKVEVSVSSHTHTVSVETSSEQATSQEENKTWTNKPIKVEPHSYSLIYIMKL